MKTLACAILFALLAFQLNAAEARLTEAQVEEIATLVAKAFYHNDRQPTGASYDPKSGIWNCLINGPGLGGALFIAIRDKDAYYRVLVDGPTPTDKDFLQFRMNPILKRRIAKITERKG